MKPADQKNVMVAQAVLAVLKKAPDAQAVLRLVAQELGLPQPSGEQARAMFDLLKAVAPSRGDQPISGGDFLGWVAEAYEKVSSTGAIAACLGPAFEPLVFYVPSADGYAALGVDDDEDETVELGKAAHFFSPDSDDLEILRERHDDEQGRFVSLSEARQREVEGDRISRASPSL